MGGLIGAAAWLALHFMEHCEYTVISSSWKTGHTRFLRSARSFTRTTCFWARTAYVISLSQSPENRFKDGDPVSLCHNCVGYRALRNGAEICDNSREILNIDAPKIIIWNNILEKLPKLKIGPDGELMEYPENFELPEPGHRHFAHLIGVFPARTITEEKCPELFEAARRALELRLSYGGGHTGWSRARVSSFYAEFGDAEKALSI